jgi:hypothetical protein
MFYSSAHTLCIRALGSEVGGFTGTNEKKELINLRVPLDYP